MDFNYISWIINLLMMVAMYLLKTAHSDIKERLKVHDEEISHVKERYLKRDDFKDFKEELWRRLDKIDLSVETIREK